MTNVILPLYSMRSYETGKYALLKDGNFKLHINRMNWDNDILVVPYIDQWADHDEFKALFPNIRTFAMAYGKNAYETRRDFWKLNVNQMAALSTRGDILVTDVTGYQGGMPFINNFNITKDPDNPRFYIDEFINLDIDSVNRAEKTFVLNQGQKDYLGQFVIDLDKIEVCQKVVSNKYFRHMYWKTPKNVWDKDYLDFDIFFPFRISDKAYDFERVVKENPNKRIFITDPNDSYNANHPNVVKKQVTKLQFYSILNQMDKFQFGVPTGYVIYYEDPEKVFHPGLADFLFFDVEIVSPYKIPTREEVMIDDSQTDFYRWG